MYQNAHDAYLETQIVTATPQRLRLMLIEGAIRRIDLANLAFGEGRESDGFDALLRTREIITELLAGIRPDGTPLTMHAFDLYGFLFRHISLAIQDGNMEKAREVQGILNEERITWQQICEKHSERLSEAGTSTGKSKEIAAPKTLTGTPWAGQAALGGWTPVQQAGGVSSGLSFDA